MKGKKRLQMQRPPQPIQKVETFKDAPEELSRNRVNQYTCGECGGVITTIDRHEGTTPAMLLCRVTEDCNGTMHSARYTCEQTLTPDYEWYKPAKLPRDIMREHVAMGGLLIRKLGEA